MTEFRMDAENNCFWIGNEQKGIQFAKDGVHVWENGKEVLHWVG